MREHEPSASLVPLRTETAIGRPKLSIHNTKRHTRGTYSGTATTYIPQYLKYLGNPYRTALGPWMCTDTPPTTKCDAEERHPAVHHPSSMHISRQIAQIKQITSMRLLISHLPCGAVASPPLLQGSPPAPPAALAALAAPPLRRRRRRAPQPPSATPKHAARRKRRPS